MAFITEELEIHWANVAVAHNRNEREYDRAIKRLNELLDEIGDNEKHPLYSLLDTLGTLTHAYEEKHYPAYSLNAKSPGG
jgi:HTH-type transcriptional regulator / antitoxin HigA